VDNPINPLTVLFLINAIHFKGGWTEQFDKKQTREIPFTLAGGAVKQHPVMFQSGDYRYLQEEGFQAVCLPYGNNCRVGMYIFLPEPGRSLRDFYGTLSASRVGR
jgi:serpin B